MAGYYSRARGERSSRWKNEKCLRNATLLCERKETCYED